MKWKYYYPVFEYEQFFVDFGWPWFGHKRFAYDLIMNLKPGVVVELGTHRGTSLFSFCQAIKDGNIDTRIFAIDTWKGDAQTLEYPESIFQDVQKIKDQIYPLQKITLLRKTFDEAVDDFPDNSIDILHIDGFHSYDAVKNDFDQWSRKMKDEGIILFHDIFINKETFGVYKFWEELKTRYNTIEFYHSYGLGVLFLKSALAEYEFDYKNLQMYYSYINEDTKNQKINYYLKINEDLRNEIAIRDRKLELLRSSLLWKIRGIFLKIKNNIIFIK